MPLAVDVCGQSTTPCQAQPRHHTCSHHQEQQAGLGVAGLVSRPEVDSGRPQAQLHILVGAVAHAAGRWDAFCSAAVSVWGLMLVPVQPHGMRMQRIALHLQPMACAKASLSLHSCKCQLTMSCTARTAGCPSAGCCARSWGSRACRRNPAQMDGSGMGNFVRLHPVGMFWGSAETTTQWACVQRKQGSGCLAQSMPVHNPVPAP